tara:strand:- start:243 stop:455 length:213 start_codon:yes stop_codon:yes gene_type:complete
MKFKNLAINKQMKTTTTEKQENKCDLQGVSHQRELLIDFKKWHSDWGGKWFTDEHEASIVDEYLKTINCG